LPEEVVLQTLRSICSAETGEALHR
jgi:hypothetical protein